MPRIDIILAIGLIVFCLVSYAFIIPNQAETEGLGEVSSAFMPRFGVVIVGLMAIILLTKAILQVKKSDSLKKEKETSSEERNRILIALALLIFFALTVEILGFPIVIPATLVSFMFFLGYRNLKFILLLSLLFTLALYAFFDRTLHILLPVGSLLNRFFN